MADLQINVDPRTVTGKHTRRLRAAGIVPGVVFGKKAGSVAVQLDAKTLDQLFRDAGRTSIVQISVGGASPTSAGTCPTRAPSRRPAPSSRFSSGIR